MSTKPDNKPCACCGTFPERTGDFNDYLQCNNQGCPQRCMAIYESVWPLEMTPEQVEKAWRETAI